MQCNNCGAQLNGTETMCPMCGAQINMMNYQATQMGMNQNIPQGNNQNYNQQMMPQANVVGQNNNNGLPLNQEQMNPNNNMMGNTFQQPMISNSQMPIPAMNNASLASPTEEKKDNKLVILILAVVAIGLIIAGIVIAISLPEPAPVVTPIPTPTETPEATPTNIIKYGGYTFTILDGYTTKEDNDYGLIFMNDRIAYSIKVDYTNNYDYYKESLKKLYPTQASTLELSYEQTKYLILQMASETTGIRSLHYVKSANEKTSFVGAIVRKDGKPGEMSDLKDLTDLLNNATPPTEELTPGNEFDSGITGIVNLPTSYTPFVFKEAESQETNGENTLQ